MGGGALGTLSADGLETAIAGLPPREGGGGGGLFLPGVLWSFMRRMWIV